MVVCPRDRGAVHAPTYAARCSPVTRTVAGLTPATQYQREWVTHQAILPPSNAAGLVVTSAGVFTTAP